MEIFKIFFTLIGLLMKRIYLTIILNKKLRNYKKYQRMLNFLKSYSEEHKKLIDFLRLNLNNPEICYDKKKLKILSSSEKKMKELKKKLKFLKKNKKGKELYTSLMVLLGIHSREIFFIRKYFNSFKKNDPEMTKYYLFVIQDLLKKDEKASEEFVESIENFIKGPII
ncbi:MAG: hypothetical protein ABIN73_10155 [candidate division WOR-3 bacterium]